MEKTKKITSTFLFLPFLMFAQENKENFELITDRPDATESPNTVPQHHFQIETGVYYESFKETDIKNETKGFNTTLLRFGILENLELRTGWNFEEQAIENINEVKSGFSPLLVGMKVSILNEKNFLPQIGLLGHLYLPFSAGHDYKPETTGVDFRFAFSHTLSEKSSLSYNLGAEWRNASPETVYFYSLSYGYSFGNCGIYAEIYGDFPENSKANHFVDAGITYLINPNLQWDATLGKSFTKGQDILLSTGFSYRIPK